MIYRKDLGRPLTANEVDSNFLSSAFLTSSSHTVIVDINSTTNINGMVSSDLCTIPFFIDIDRACQLYVERISLDAYGFVKERLDVPYNITCTAGVLSVDFIDSLSVSCDVDPTTHYLTFKQAPFPIVAGVPRIVYIFTSDDTFYFTAVSTVV
ncbi:MAG: hypothetical protein WC656_03280 [Sulfurimonas sp.]|jgi:hypothetical protein